MRSRGKRKRRILGLVAVPAIGLVGAAFVGYVPETRLAVVAESGAPVAGAYAACTYSGQRFNFVDSITYLRPGRVVRSDAAGGFVLPRLVHGKGPLDGYARAHLRLVYAPALHNARRVWSLDEGGDGSAVWVSRGRLVLRNLEDDPVGWEQTLEQLYGFLRYEALVRPGEARPARVAVAPALLRELARHLGDEVEAFARRHGTPAVDERIARVWRPRLTELERQLQQLE